MPSNIITICSTSETCVVSAVAGLIFAQLRSTIHRIDKFSPWTQSKLTWLGRMSRELGMVWCAGRCPDGEFAPYRNDLRKASVAVKPYLRWDWLACISRSRGARAAQPAQQRQPG